MARGLNQETLNTLGGDELFPFLSVDFTDGTSEYKYTTLEVPICLTDYGTTASGVYQPRGFEIEGLNYTVANVMDDCTLNIDNVKEELHSPFISNDIQGNKASVYLGALNHSNEVIFTLLLFTGNIDGFNFSGSKIQMTIGSVFTKWSDETYTGHPSSCPYKVFKGDRCKYSGAITTCDRRYVTCQLLENNDNFGGFRWLPSIENKKFQWGPTQEEAEYIAAVAAWHRRH